eukprot:2975084-Rhodomonas_salina.1
MASQSTAASRDTARACALGAAPQGPTRPCSERAGTQARIAHSLEVLYQTTDIEAWKLARCLVHLPRPLIADGV